MSRKLATVWSQKLPNLDTVLKWVQSKCLERNPAIVLGSGASAAYQIPGMVELQRHLESSIHEDRLADMDKKVWRGFLDMLPSKGLEETLFEITLSETLAELVMESTWSLINDADLRVHIKVMDDNHHLALSRLFRYLFNSSNNIVHIITTNYDRIPEYASSAAGFRAFTGFTGGHFATWKPEQWEGYYKDHSQNRQIQIRTVCIWKVHGSLDWFRARSGSIMAMSHCHGLNSNHTPLIITPGIRKYEDTHYEPFRSVLTNADACLSKSKSFLVVGYGFNDRHVQPKLQEQCYENGASILILAKELSPAARSFIESERCTDFVAMEDHPGGTMCYTNSYPKGEVIPDIKIWNLADLLENTL